MEWIILFFIVLFLIGRAQHNSVVGPYAGMTPNSSAVTGASSGDTFSSNVSTIASGIPQTGPFAGTGITPPEPHAVFPVSTPATAPAPVPIAIQKGSVVASSTTPKPLLPRSTTNPLTPKPLGTGAGTGTRVYGIPHYRGY